MTVLVPERTQAERAAADGASYLDAHGPEGWRERIDPGRLDIGSECDCVLGQLYGHYQDGLHAIGLAGKDNYRHWVTRDLGFNGAVSDFSEITEAWKAQL